MGQMKHWSDCAVHNEPAYPAGECSCGGYYEDERPTNEQRALTEWERAFNKYVPEKPIPPTFQDWVRAIRERNEQAAQPKRKMRRSGY